MASDRVQVHDNVRGAGGITAAALGRRCRGARRIGAATTSAHKQGVTPKGGTASSTPEPTPRGTCHSSQRGVGGESTTATAGQTCVNPALSNQSNA